MRILIASIQPDELRAARDFGIHGIITNPTVIAAVPRPWEVSVEEAAAIVPDGPFHLQVTEDHDREAALAQAVRFRAVLGERLVVKACITREMLSIIPRVQATGHEVNITGIVTATQAYVAAQAGADYLSLYLGRAEKAGIDSIEMVDRAATFIAREGLDCRVIAASVQSVEQYDDATMAGASYVACPPPLLGPLIQHEATDASIEGFHRDWESIPTR